MITARSLYFGWILALAPVAVSALSDDRDQPIAVEADNLEIREQENISIYEGNVKLIQGSLDIVSDRLVIHFNKANELVRMEMTGNPARFLQLDDQRREMRGEGQRIEYLESGSVLRLEGAARFSHDGDTVESEWIHINTEDDTIQAGSKEKDRVRMVIQPANKNSAGE